VISNQWSVASGQSVISDAGSDEH